MKKSVKLPVVATALAIALTGTTMAQTSYPDVLEGKWYTTAIESAVSNGLLSGYEDGTMKPENSITRAEIAAVLSKAFGATENASLGGYPDVSSREWYYNVMAKAVKMQIFTGDNNGYLNPNNPITREETAVVIAKAFELSNSGEDVLARFADEDMVSEWAVPYVSALVENGYMSGNEKNELNPKGNITRAEFAQIMSNITNDYVATKGTVEESFDGSVVVRVADVVMKDLTVDGDLIVADGVGRGDFTLDNVTVEGNLVIRGGGINSIELKNGSKVKGRVVARNHGGKTRIAADDTSEISSLVVNTDVIIDGDCKEVSVESSADVEVKGNVETIDVNAEDVEISGNGKVENVNANADNTEVKVKGASVTAAEGVTGVTAGNKTVEAGKTETVKTTTSSSGGSSGGSASTGSTTVYLTYTISKNEEKGIYEIVSAGNEDDISNLDKDYVVSITGLGEAINQTVSDGATAVTLIRKLLGATEFDMYTFINTIDNRKLNANYDVYKAIAQPVVKDLLGDEEYAYLKKAEEDAIAKYGEANVKLADVVATYEDGETGKLEAKIEELLTRAEGEQKVEEYANALIEFVGIEGFINLLLTTK